jgi:hypothetical protein
MKAVLHKYSTAVRIVSVFAYFRIERGAEKRGVRDISCEQIQIKLFAGKFLGFTRFLLTLDAVDQTAQIDNILLVSRHFL